MHWPCTSTTFQVQYIVSGCLYDVKMFQSSSGFYESTYRSPVEMPWIYDPLWSTWEPRIKTQPWPPYSSPLLQDLHRWLGMIWGVNNRDATSKSTSCQLSPIQAMKPSKHVQTINCTSFGGEVIWWGHPIWTRCPPWWIYMDFPSGTILCRYAWILPIGEQLCITWQHKASLFERTLKVNRSHFLPLQTNL